MKLLSLGRADVFRDVFRFTFAHWRRQPARTALIAGAVALSTATDVLMPVYAGRLVDALALAGADRDAALNAALLALAAIVGLGALAIAMRHLAFIAIIRFTLKIMSDVAQEPSIACSASPPTGMPTPSPARRCAR